MTITSIRLLAERNAEWMRGIDADDAQFLREEFQFFQREGKIPVVRVAIDVGVELRRKEISLDHVAFQLGHVDAVGRKPAHRLVERGGKVADAEDKRRHQRTCILRRPFFLMRQDHEARGVVGFVLDVLRQNIQSVNVSRQTRRDRRAAFVGAFGDDPR